MSIRREARDQLKKMLSSSQESPSRFPVGTNEGIKQGKSQKIRGLVGEV